MHGLGVIHRYVKFDQIAMIKCSADLSIPISDMKPENVLLDEKMRVKITDFGTAKTLSDSAPGEFEGSRSPMRSAHKVCIAEERATSFVGSPGYISPELLLSSGCGKRFVRMPLHRLSAC